MKIVNSVSGIPIRLTQERVGHITRRHPETNTEEERILETLAHPDYVQVGDAGTLVVIRRYPKTPLSEKCCAVVYRETSDGDGFVLTAYFTNSPAERRRTIWRQ